MKTNKEIENLKTHIEKNYATNLRLFIEYSNEYDELKHQKKYKKANDAWEDAHCYLSRCCEDAELYSEIIKTGYNDALELLNRLCNWGDN